NRRSPPPSLSSITRLPPRPTLFPYTTLFRSLPHAVNAVFFALSLVVAAVYFSLVHRCVEALRPLQPTICSIYHPDFWLVDGADRDRKSTRLNSSHDQISYAVFCLKKKKQNIR